MDIDSVDLNLPRIFDAVYTEGNVSRTAIRWLRTEHVGPLVRSALAMGGRWRVWRARNPRGGIPRALARNKQDQRKPSKRMAFCFRISGMTSGRKPATWKSCIQRSGVIKG